jgi:alkyl hydroperoxide reductase subunit D
MTISEIKSQLGDFAKDTKLNLGSILNGDGEPDLTEEQTVGIALACAYSVSDKTLVDALLVHGENILSEAQIEAAKGAATIMAMNNIYYRFVHLSGEHDYATMPANLRMNILAKPGIDHAEFELYALAISAINGCGMCIKAHVKTLEKAEVSKLGIQSCIRIAAVINATKQALTI